MAENVLVTGGADSVGRVISQAFAARGDKVHICDVNAAALAQTLAANPAMRGTLANVGDRAEGERQADSQNPGEVPHRSPPRRINKARRGLRARVVR